MYLHKRTPAKLSWPNSKAPNVTRNGPKGPCFCACECVRLFEIEPCVSLFVGVWACVYVCATSRTCGNLATWQVVVGKAIQINFATWRESEKEQISERNELKNYCLGRQRRSKFREIHKVTINIRLMQCCLFCLKDRQQTKCTKIFILLVTWQAGRQAGRHTPSKQGWE